MPNPITVNANKLSGALKQHKFIAYAYDTGGTVGCRRCDIYPSKKCSFKWEYNGDARIESEKGAGASVRIEQIDYFNLENVVFVPIVERPELKHSFNIYGMKTLAENTFEVDEKKLGGYYATIFLADKSSDAKNFASKQLEDNLSSYGIREPARIDKKPNPKKRAWISDNQWQNCLDHMWLLLVQNQ